MTNVTIVIPDAFVPKLRVAMRQEFPQYAELGDLAAFRAVTADFWRGVYRTAPLRAANVDLNAAQQQAIAAADAETAEIG